MKEAEGGRKEVKLQSGHNEGPVDPTGSFAAGMTLQSCPKSGQRQTFISHVAQGTEPWEWQLPSSWG